MKIQSTNFEELKMQNIFRTIINNKDCKDVALPLGYICAYSDKQESERMDINDVPFETQRRIYTVAAFFHLIANEIIKPKDQRDSDNLMSYFQGAIQYVDEIHDDYPDIDFNIDFHQPALIEMHSNNLKG